LISLDCLPAIAQQNETVATNSSTDNDAEGNDYYIDCLLCENSTHFPQDPFSIFLAGDATLTCQSAYDLGPIRLPKENCTFWQNRGATICQCAAEPPPKNECKLCEDGSKLPDPLLEGRPGLACAQLEIKAKRDSPENCIVWQQTQGVYCGCDNVIVTSNEKNVCRLCSEKSDLLDPLTMVFQTDNRGLSSGVSCGELEFTVNLPENKGKCGEAIAMYGKHCCREYLSDQDPNEKNNTGEEDMDGSSALGSKVFPGFFCYLLLLWGAFDILSPGVI
jgi:hypothetical protein